MPEHITNKNFWKPIKKAIGFGADRSETTFLKVVGLEQYLAAAGLRGITVGLEAVGLEEVG